MKIIQINYTDLPGHIFNGYDLMDYLNQRGHDVWQVVRKKVSNNEKVIQVGYDWIIHEQIRELEARYGVDNLLFPYAEQILNLEILEQADIIHCHILHNDFISILDYQRLFNNKKVVWTIHDPWVLTGGCIHPLNCKGWLSDCKQCDDYPSRIYETKKIRTTEMKRLKKQMWRGLTPNIVVSSDFMQQYLQMSPMTSHIKNIYKIPFGVKISEFESSKRIELKKRHLLSGEKIVIGFRQSNDENKGCKYIFEALSKFRLEDRVKLVTVGKGCFSDVIKKSYETEELGWCDEKKMMEFWNKIDFFIMPSLAETFGLMAIESMAAFNPVVCFRDTEVAKVVQAPEIGIDAEYASSISLGEVIYRMVRNPDEILKRSVYSRKLVEKKYVFDDYATKHEKLYKKIMEN